MMRSETSILRRKTSKPTQVEVVRTLSLGLRAFGVGVAFFTMVCLWEAMDIAISRFGRGSALEVETYLILTPISAACLVGCHYWVKQDEDSVMGPFAYALSTLFLAVSAWGLIAAVVRMVIDKRLELGFWALGSVVGLLVSLFYYLQTDHNALIDIVSCTVSLGLQELEYEEDEIEPLLPPRTLGDLSEGYSSEDKEAV